MLSTFIKLPFVIKIFLLSIFEWPLKTDFTVFQDIPHFWGKRYLSGGVLNLKWKDC